MKTNRPIARSGNGKNSSINPTIPLIIVGIIGVLLYFVGPILPPFLVGALLAWLFNPLITLMVKHKIPRILSVFLVFLVFVFVILVVVLLIVPMLFAQIVKLAHLIPDSIKFLERQVLPGLMNYSIIEPESLKKLLADNWMKAGGAASWVVTVALHSGMTVLGWIGNFLLTPIVAFYLLYDWQRVLDFGRSLIPRRNSALVILFIKECDSVLAAFFRGQLSVMLTLGSIYAVGLTLLGIQVGVLIGLVAGLLAIVPYLGVAIGLISASIVAWVEAGNWHAMLPVVGLFLTVQILDATIITPKLIGHRIGLHPVAVIFAILAGGKLFGFTGVLIALPTAAVIRVLLRFFDKPYRDQLDEII